METYFNMFMMKSFYFQLAIALGATASCLAEDIQSTGVNLATEMAKATLPTARQLAWQQREVEALIHFGVNTFTGREWGGGKESTSIFNPPNVDAEQWIAAAKSFGAKAVVFTTKHHDGFCLWPTATTPFSVKNCPWREGKGDLVREVADACRKADIGFGVYISPADLHEPTYGWNSAKYNDFFCAQLRELLTNYGPVCEVFFDGATPGPRQQSFDWQRYHAVIRELQPGAVISIRGPDVRWVGSESGSARLTEWSVIPIENAPEKHDWRDLLAQDIGSKERIKDKQHLVWHPAVADVSLRRTWFWAPDTDQSIKTVEELMSIYEQSVGRNAGLQLNIAPDRSGRIPDADVARLKEFGETLQAYFSRNLCAARGSTVEKEKGERETPLKQTVNFSAPTHVRYVVLQEDIAKGQLIEKVDLTLIRANGQEKLRSATTVGWKRIIKTDIPDVVAIVVEVKESRSAPHFTVAAY